MQEICSKKNCFYVHMLNTIFFVFILKKYLCQKKNSEIKGTKSALSDIVFILFFYSHF